jgi:uncharacterized SAM-binding protein YcdF (DUF218 family)
VNVPSTINSQHHQPSAACDPVASGPAARKWPRRLLWLAVFCFLLSVFCFIFRGPLLTGLAKAWIVNDPLEKADAIVVLGGGLETRPFEAARLYHEGLAPKVLLMDVKLAPTTKLGITAPEMDLTRQVLLKQEVPGPDCITVGHGVGSTYDESRAVRAWLAETGARKVIIPTDLFHTRRVRWLFHKQLKGTGATVKVRAVAPSEYSASDWWTHEEGLIAFQNEVVKSIYYLFKY